MYTLNPVSARVAKMRDKYRSTRPELCLSRYKIITEFYQKNPQLTGILKRALCFKDICEKIVVCIHEDEVIVGSQAGKYRACAIYPENSIDWLLDEARSRYISTRDIDPYILSEEDRAFLLETGDFWMKESLSAKLIPYLPEGYWPHLGNGVSSYAPGMAGGTPVGHFCTNYDRAIRVGFGAIRDEALEKMRSLEENGIFGTSIDQYNFYRAVSIVCDGMIILTKRYAALAKELAEKEADPGRKAELEAMADSLSHIMEKPCRTFHDAVQCLFMYQTCLCLDANMHGISWGRIDQYLGDFYEADLAAGRITPEYAQELMDLFYLKVAEMNKAWSYGATQSNPGYTSGQLMTLGGVKKDGSDATNAVTYMMLQTSGRLILHSPPQALRIHAGTPEALWEAAIETTKIAGGVPSFENDEVIIPALMGRGLSLEDARDYCLIGCVEPAGTGTEWPACGGNGCCTFMNLTQAFVLAINDGFLTMPGRDGTMNPNRVGAKTGYLYEMETFEDLQAAVKAQMELFIKWHASCTNSFEYVAREQLPLPVVSATMEGCMEKGMDVMRGGAKYNSTGIAGVGIGNLADCLAVTKYMVFDKKLCSARELYDALMSNWDGKEFLRQRILNEAPHYGNANPYCDEMATWASDVFANACNSSTGPRGRYSAGLYPVTTNVMFGKMTSATPDGRMAGVPLADGISPVQQMDTNGPTAILNSVSAIRQEQFPNGTLLNMKFHPTALAGEEGKEKLRELMKTYFNLGGMEMQINITSAKILRDAQAHPEEHKNLVVRVAGFSAYFVELHPDGQEDLIRRTELAL